MNLEKGPSYRMSNNAFDAVHYISNDKILAINEIVVFQGD